METTCTHCSQSIEIDPEIPQCLQDQTHFECPACAGAVEVPAMPVQQAVAPLLGRNPVARPNGKKATSTQTGKAGRKKTSKPVPRPGSATPSGTLQGLNRNLRILGAIALLMLGGLGIFIASRKGGTTSKTVQNIINETIHNQFFSDLIASGATTEKELLASLADLQAYGTGFIGVSREKFTAAQAPELAKRTGSKILTLDEPGAASRQPLLEWLFLTYPELHGSTTWIMDGGEAKVIDSPDVNRVTTLDMPRKVFLGWYPKAPSNAQDRHSVAIQSTDPVLPHIFKTGEWLNVSIAYTNPGPGPVRIWAIPFLKGKSLLGYSSSNASSHAAGSGAMNDRFTFNKPAEIDEIRVKLIDMETKEMAFTLLPVQAAWQLDPNQWSIELTTIGAPAVLSPVKEISMPVTPGKQFKLNLTANYKTPVPTKLASNLLLADAKILPPEFLAELTANHNTTWHFDTESRPGYHSVEGSGDISFDLTGYAPKENGTYSFNLNLGLFDKRTWNTIILKLYKVTLIADGQ